MSFRVSKDGYRVIKNTLVASLFPFFVFMLSHHRLYCANDQNQAFDLPLAATCRLVTQATCVCLVEALRDCLRLCAQFSQQAPVVLAIQRCIAMQSAASSQGVVKFVLALR